MNKLALLARLEARLGKEEEIEKMLMSALALAEAEPQTNTWYVLRLGPTTFGIFDTFADEAGREAHLNGEIAKTLMAKAPELLSQNPVIEKVDILAYKH